MSELISHRGNITKPIPERENKPSYIDAAIQLGYKVEVDLRYISNKLWLGHDQPEVEVNHAWLLERAPYLWLHCKNILAANYLGSHLNTFQYFCHSNDAYVLTSTGKLWVHDLEMPLGNNTIIPLITKSDIENYPGPPVSAYCTDYVIHAGNVLKQRGLL